MTTFGKQVSFNIPRHGDLLNEIKFELPDPQRDLHLRNLYRQYLQDLVHFEKKIKPLLRKNLPRLMADRIFFYYRSQKLSTYSEDIQNYGKRNKKNTQFKWCDNIGHQLIKSVDVSIGDYNYYDWR